MALSITHPTFDVFSSDRFAAATCFAVSGLDGACISLLSSERRVLSSWKYSHIASESFKHSTSLRHCSPFFSEPPRH